MSLIKYNNRNRLFPWGNTGLRSFFDTSDFFSDDFFAEDELMPAMNIKEHEADFEVEFAAPGFTKEDFEVTLDNNILNVSGEKEKTHEEKEENYSRKEFSYNSFKRSLQLPTTVNTNQEVKATYENGILKLHLQKNEETPKNPKKVIKVQ
ncbi:spore protein SP21 [Kordia sp. SMS9]|uniref:Hsp20/alpha crystallin family protein n=1 Tax=Kordia sp. SMS9 TaxID=2282170 RepID=UPI000E0D5356|nr:Hsp20/alpha crystallin family protein [Kordia sp. SMS9]AXG70745.1 spore protein SP21 [Kordia sp. SMS9]